MTSLSFLSAAIAAPAANSNLVDESIAAQILRDDSTGAVTVADN
jgi:hypothetical protein